MADDKQKKSEKPVERDNPSPVSQDDDEEMDIEEQGGVEEEEEVTQRNPRQDSPGT
jgi:hypothetical protein